MSDAEVIHHDAQSIVEWHRDCREPLLARPYPDIRLLCPTVEHALRRVPLREPFEHINQPDDDSTLNATSPSPALAQVSEVSGLSRTAEVGESGEQRNL